MSGATYKYSIKAESGYKSEQTGKISPERHGVVCASLDGGLSDDLRLLRAAPKILAALKSMIDSYQYEASQENPALLEAKAAVFEATGEHHEE